jgi:hypothetical protein
MAYIVDLCPTFGISRKCEYTSDWDGKSRFLSAQADPFTGVKGEEKASARFVRNDGRWRCLRHG